MFYILSWQVFFFFKSLAVDALILALALFYSILPKINFIVQIDLFYMWCNWGKITSITSNHHKI